MNKSNQTTYELEQHKAQIEKEKSEAQKFLHLMQTQLKKQYELTQSEANNKTIKALTELQNETNKSFKTKK